MATFVNLPSGSWRAIIRRKGRYISETFKFRDDARRWATAQESAIDKGAAPKGVASAFGEQGISVLSVDHGPTKSPLTAGEGMPSWLRVIASIAFKPPAVAVAKLRQVRLIKAHTPTAASS